MVCLKYFFIFLLMAQTQCRLLAEDDSSDDSSGSITIINTRVLEIIEYFVGILTQVGINVIQGINDSIDTIEDSVKNFEKIVLDIMFDIALAKINEMEEDADDATKVTYECIKQEWDDLKELSINYALVTTICGIEQSGQILNIIAPILVEIQNSNDEMKNLTQQLQDCANTADAVYEVPRAVDNQNQFFRRQLQKTTSADDVEECIDQVSEKITTTLVDLWETLKTEAAEASKLIENVEELADVCLDTATKQVEEASADLGQKLSECIQENNGRSVLSSIFTRAFNKYTTGKLPRQFLKFLEAY